jgi:hypothetical protein
MRYLVFSLGLDETPLFMSHNYFAEYPHVSGFLLFNLVMGYLPGLIYSPALLPSPTLLK